MATPRPSVTKRQREQAKRDKQLRKSQKRAERKSDESASNSLENVETSDDHSQ